MTSDQFPAFRTKVVVVVEILKNTEMQFLCTKLYIQQWWDVYPTVTYFWPHCPCSSVLFTLKMGYIADPAHIAQPEICWLNSLFPLMHGVSSNQCTLCAFFVMFVWPDRSSDIDRMRHLSRVSY